MRLLLKLGWRNIWRNKRRSLLTLAAISFATLAAVAMRGVQLGTYAVNIKNAVQLFTGYLQIQRAGYQENPKLNLSFKLDKKLEKNLRSIPQIKGFAPRVYANGLISFKDNSIGAGIFGIDPLLEQSTTKILERISKGRFFTTDTTNEVVVGDKLLINLKADIGDTIVILAQGYDGSLGNLKFVITGTVRTGSKDFDAMAVFIGLETAQNLLSIYGHNVQAVALTLDDLSDIEDVKTELNAGLDTSKMKALSWDEVMPDFKQSIELDNISGILMLLVLIIIVAFGILNTVLMSVTERFNEFGITLSLGMPQIKLVQLIFIETIFITILGVLIGDLLGWSVNYYILLNPIEFSGDLGWVYEEYGFLPRIESTLDFTIFLNTSISVLLISLVACFYPAYKVFKLEPLKGIRYT